MKYLNKTHWILTILLFFITSCSDDFLVRGPLDTPTAETFWTSAENAEMWINNLYNGLPIPDDTRMEAFSDNAFGRAGGFNNVIASGLFEPNDPNVEREWDYSYIRRSLEFFEFVSQVPNIPPAKLAELSGQAHFMIAFHYYRLTTLFGDVPLVTKPLSISESDIGSNPKAEVVTYILSNLDQAIANLPVSWPAAQNGRITKGAAMTLKARVLLYNNRWAEAATTAKQVMDLGVYRLHPNFRELYLQNFNNRTNEVILARQFAANANTHRINRIYAPVAFGGFALILASSELEKSFGMSDGLSVTESPLYDPTEPFKNRDPRYYQTFLFPGDNLNGRVLDLTGTENNFARTYLYFRKYTNDLVNSNWPSHANWIIFRYADVLLMYAEAKNEASGPDDSIYEALDLIRLRAGLPTVDRTRYNSQSSVREFIRNERRVELAGEGLRYFDIIRWRIAESVLTGQLRSLDLSLWASGPKTTSGAPLLVARNLEVRRFNPSRHYVWPVPQVALDRSKNLKQNSVWQ